MNVNNFVFSKSTATLNGTLIKSLNVIDGENVADWSICYNFNKGSQLFGDRTLTCTDLPEKLVGAEYIRTACDSKLVLSQLAGFTAAEDTTIYVAIDSRVTNLLPDWLKDWKNSGLEISTTDPSSNNLTLELYQKNFKSGETVTLGTNGGSNESVNYIVLATPKEIILNGDVNLDGVINAFDMAAAKRGLINGFTNTLSYEAADVDENGIVEVGDLQQIKDFILGRIKIFTKSTT